MFLSFPIGPIIPNFCENITSSTKRSVLGSLQNDVFQKNKEVQTEDENGYTIIHPIGVGSERNPFEIDFSARGKRSANTICPYGMGDFFKIYEDESDYNTKKNKDSSSAVVEGFEVYQWDLRHMQWHGEEFTKEFYKKCEYEYERIADKKKFPTFEEYVEARKKAVLNCHKAQLNDLKKVEPLEKDEYFWRGFGIGQKDGSDFDYFGFGLNKEDQLKFANYIDNCRKGDIITPDWASICTSPDIKMTEPFCYDSLFRIKAPKGSRVFNVGTEKEVRFPSKSEFKVLNKINCNGLKIIELEYIMPKLD